MKGVLKEILLPFTLGLSALIAFSLPKSAGQRGKPQIAHEEPTAVSGLPDDPHLSLAWGLQEIHGPAAWKRQKGSRNVIVAVIDTGCDVHHPDLSQNIWTNPGESGLDRFGDPKSTNGIDDDDNGFVDDVHGWNFSAHNADIEDDHGHGTHIAGIIGGLHTGVARQVSLMCIKYFEPEASGEDNLRYTIAAIRYAVNMGADIINYSGGGVVRNQEEEKVIRWAAAQGVLVVAAAGNEGVNSDFFHFYPADYELPNILSVAAIDQKSQLMKVSNYGIRTVALAAPGKNIYSTLPNGQHGYMSGTSQATAFASGVAALLIAQDPQMRSPRALIDHLLTNASRRPSLRGKLRSAGVLDAKLALEKSRLELSQFDDTTK